MTHSKLSDWERACYIHLIPFPKNNEVFSSFVNSHDYERFSQEVLDIGFIKDMETNTTLVNLYNAITVSDQKALKLWGQYTETSYLSPNMRKLCIRYSPHDVIDAASIKKLTTSEHVELMLVHKKVNEEEKKAIATNRQMKIINLENEMIALQRKLKALQEETQVS